MKHQLPNSRLLAYILSSNFNLPILHWVSFETDVSMYKKILSSARVRRFDDFQYYGLLHGSLMTFVTARKDIYIYFFYFFTMHGDFLKRMKAFLFFFFLDMLILFAFHHPSFGSQAESNHSEWINKDLNQWMTKITCNKMLNEIPKSCAKW